MNAGKKSFDSSLLSGYAAGGYMQAGRYAEAGRNTKVRPAVRAVSLDFLGRGNRLGLGNWMLPSGKALAEFAFQAGFLAPLLLRAPGFPVRGTERGARRRHRDGI